MTGFDDDALRALVEANPGQATFEEYRLVRDTIVERAPCTVLVFGVGRDSAVWIAANQGGTTRFLEDDHRWIDEARRRDPQATIDTVRYGTRRAFTSIALRVAAARRIRGLPRAVEEQSWDVVFVDGPRGTRWHTPGRVPSIAAAARLAGPSGHVLVHDCHRWVEQAACDRFLGHARLREQVGSMRSYALGPGPGTS